MKIVSQEHFAAAVNLAIAEKAASLKTIQHGPGTELTALLADWLGIVSSPGCSCRAMAQKMNAIGPEWCESDDGMAEILAVMQAEHAKRRAARQTILPWSETAARTLVRIACKRARHKLAAG